MKCGHGRASGPQETASVHFWMSFFIFLGTLLGLLLPCCRGHCLLRFALLGLPATFPLGGFLLLGGLLAFLLMVVRGLA